MEYRKVWWFEWEPQKCESTLLKKRKKMPSTEYLEEFGALDTESSHNHAERKEDLVCWVYQWAFVFGEEIVIGRKPSELVYALKKLAEVNALGDGGKKAIFYVHNLSYDLPYIRRFLEKEFGEVGYLALDANEFLYYENSCFVLRCSYKLANRSLDVWSKDLGTEHRKRIGLVDYDAIHTQQEELTEADWAYMCGDVIVLHECVEKQMELFKDDLLSIPMTSTGYVRREFRTMFHNDKKAIASFKKTALCEREYTMLEKEYSGGYTHGNRFFANRVVEGNIRHRDFRSHYPSQIAVRKFPVGKIILSKENATKNAVLSEIYSGKYVYVEARVKNGRLTNNKKITFPTLSYSTLIEGAKTVIEASVDNGRVLSFYGESVVYLDMYDLKWLMYCYNFEEIEFLKVWTCRQEYLKNSNEKFIWEVTKKYYYEKSYWKHKMKKAKTEEEKEDARIHLQLSKALLNAIYGCLAMKPVRAMLEENGMTWEWIKKEVFSVEEKKEALGDFYGRYSSCTRFELGCAITAMARDELFTLIYKVIGGENVLYCDTDSCFYLSTPEIEARIVAYNEKCYKKAIELGAFIESDGETVTFDSFDDEEEEIHEFSFLHAKCYAYTEGESRTLHCTIAGVNQKVVVGIDENEKPIYYTREEELGSIENLVPGFIFKKCGGLRGVHLAKQPFEYEGQECSGGVILMRATKKLSYTEEAHLTNYRKWIYAET